MTSSTVSENNGLLTHSIKQLLEKAEKAVQEKNIDKLEKIDTLIKRFFCKKIAYNKYDDLRRFNPQIGDFLIRFEWGGKPRWEEAVPVITEWKTILKLNQYLLQTESPQKAYDEVIKIPYGVRLFLILHDRKAMKLDELEKAIKTIPIKQLNEEFLSVFEREGIIIREVEGKDVWVSLDRLGMKVFNEYFKTNINKIRKLIDFTFKTIKMKKYEKVQERLQSIRELEQNNPFVICLLGMIELERGNLSEAGTLFVKAAQLVLDREKTFQFFYLLERVKRLKYFENRIFLLNSEDDQKALERKPTLLFLSLLNEYWGYKERANKYRELASKY